MSVGTNLERSTKPQLKLGWFENWILAAITLISCPDNTQLSLSVGYLHLTCRTVRYPISQYHSIKKFMVRKIFSIQRNFVNKSLKILHDFPVNHIKVYISKFGLWNSNISKYLPKVGFKYLKKTYKFKIIWTFSWIPLETFLKMFKGLASWLQKLF